MLHEAENDWENPHIQFGVFEDPLKLFIGVKQPERILVRLEGLSVVLGDRSGQVDVEGKVEIPLVDLLNNKVQDWEFGIVWLSNQFHFSNLKDLDSRVEVLDQDNLPHHQEVILFFSSQHPEEHGV